jgi:hypothetical protein
MFALSIYKTSMQERLEFERFWKAESGGFEEHYFNFKY